MRSGYAVDAAMLGRVDDSEVLTGGAANRGRVLRIGDHVHRPRRKGADVAEALLLHLEAVGFEGAPRFLGHDDEGRQVLSYLPGDVHTDQRPPWLEDDEANAQVLGRLAGFVRDVHEATAGFVPPADAEPFRPLPLAGDVWNHADVHYGNTVFAGEKPIALIDWECCAPGNGLYDLATLLFSARCPRPDRPDAARREHSALLAVDAILDGHRATRAQRAGFFADVATTFDDVADFIEHEANGYTAQQKAEAPDRLRWTAEWWRSRSS